jgi:hypothetical protein
MQNKHAIINKVLKKFAMSSEDTYTTSIELDGDLKDLIAKQDNVNPNDIDLIKGTIDLTWKLEMEARNWGIKSISAIVPNQKINLKYDYIINNDGDTEERRTTLEIKNIAIDYEAPTSSNGVGFVPVKLEYYKNKFTAVFYGGSV